MKKSLAITLSVLFLVLGAVSLFQVSNPNFVAAADTLNQSIIPATAIILGAGFFFIVISAIILMAAFLPRKEK